MEKKLVENTTLDLLKVGQECVITGVFGDGDIKMRLYELGFVPGEKVKCIMKSPLNDPKAYFVKNTLIALRCDDSKNISVFIRHN